MFFQFEFERFFVNRDPSSTQVIVRCYQVVLIVLEFDVCGAVAAMCSSNCPCEWRLLAGNLGRQSTVRGCENSVCNDRSDLREMLNYIDVLMLWHYSAYSSQMQGRQNVGLH